MYHVRVIKLLGRVSIVLCTRAIVPSYWQCLSHRYSVSTNQFCLLLIKARIATKHVLRLPCIQVIKYFKDPVPRSTVAIPANLCCRIAAQASEAEGRRVEGEYQPRPLTYEGPYTNHYRDKGSQLLVDETSIPSRDSTRVRSHNVRKTFNNGTGVRGLPSSTLARRPLELKRNTP